MAVPGRDIDRQIAGMPPFGRGVPEEAMVILRGCMGVYCGASTSTAGAAAARSG